MRIGGHEWRLIVEDTEPWVWGMDRHAHGCHALYLGLVVVYLYTRWEEVRAWLDAR